jgi:hypothetical protein
MMRKGLILSLTMAGLLCLTMAAVAAKSTQGTPNGTVTITVTQAAVGVGFTWGDGTLHYEGKDYKFKVSGLNLIALGVTSINATGDVYNLTKLADFPGKYFGVEAGATVVKGSSGLVLKNTAGVVLNLKSEQKGVELKLGNEGLSISPAWK